MAEQPKYQPTPHEKRQWEFDNRLREFDVVETSRSATKAKGAKVASYPGLFELAREILLELGTRDRETVDLVRVADSAEKRRVTCEEMYDKRIAKYREMLTKVTNDLTSLLAHLSSKPCTGKWRGLCTVSGREPRYWCVSCAAAVDLTHVKTWIQPE